MRMWTKEHENVPTYLVQSLRDSAVLGPFH